ncbi:MAG: AtpZ/AtpI family protein [Rhodobacterales bacterium]|nr:AtpZ/AtpI family protein [Rhodobacterales bacterium]
MAEEPDPERLRELEARLARAKGEPRQAAVTGKGFSQGEMAWRMVIELTTGMMIGLALGYGLDELFGTRPILMIIFVMLGFAAGIRTMLQTARQMTRQDGAGTPGVDEGD